MSTTLSPTPTPLRILLPFDDSSNAKRAVEQAVRLCQRGVALDMHLLNVQPPLRSDVTRFVPADNVQSYHHDEGTAVLKAGRAILEGAGLSATEHVHVGSPAEVIGHVARDLGVDLVLMGTHGRGAVAELFMGSVAAGVLKAVDVPVMLVR